MFNNSEYLDKFLICGEIEIRSSQREKIEESEITKYDTGKKKTNNKTQHYMILHFMWGNQGRNDTVSKIDLGSYTMF